MIPRCLFPIMDPPFTCQRPAGHTSWRIEAGWPRESISAYAHMSKETDYDAEVAPYLQELP